jgi:hypothetical protein
LGKESLNLGDLKEVEFDRGFTTKDTHENRDFAFGIVDSGDSTEKVGERSFDDTNGFTHGESGLELGSGLFTKSGDSFNFVFGKRGRLVGSAHKAGNTLGGANGEPGVVGDNHTNKHIAGEKLFFDGGFLAFVDFDFLLGRDKDFKDEVFKTHGLNSGFEGYENTIFVTGLGVNDVPFGGNGGVVGDDDMIRVLCFGHKFINLFGFVFFWFHFSDLVLFQARS